MNSYYKLNKISGISNEITNVKLVKTRFKTKSLLSLLFLRLTLLSLTFALLAPIGARGQLPSFGPTGEIGDPRFSLDWSQFRSDSAGLTRLEVYYKISNTGLTFLPHQDGYVARYKMTVRVFKDDRQVGYKTIKREKIVDDLERTKLYSDYVLNLVEFNLKPDKYRISVHLEDLSTDRTVEKKRKIKLSDLSPSKHPRLSGIEFLFSSKPAQEGDDFFRKGNIVAVPLVDRGLQGGEDGGLVLYYFEIYGGKDTTLNVIVETQVTHQTAGLVYHDTNYIMMNKSQSKELRTINLKDFVPGVYSIEIALYRNEKRMKKKKSSYVRDDTFSVNWSLLGRVRHDYETVLMQLEAIATPDEKRSLEYAESDEKRIEAWTDFWEGRDPTPDTKVNESLLAFYARIRYADAHFSTPRRLGWKSDRGSIFLKRGRPDEVDDQPVSANVGAYQVWYYYNVDGEPLRYYFFDEYGDEDFRLQYPFDGRLR